MGNELGRLAQVFKNVKGNNAMFFLPRLKVPKNKKICIRIVCTIRTNKVEIT